MGCLSLTYYKENAYKFWNIYSKASPVLSKKVHTHVSMTADEENVETFRFIQVGKHIKTKQGCIDTVVYLLHIHRKPKGKFQPFQTQLQQQL